MAMPHQDLPGHIVGNPSAGSSRPRSGLDSRLIVVTGARQFQSAVLAQVSGTTREGAAELTSPRTRRRHWGQSSSPSARTPPHRVILGAPPSGPFHARQGSPESVGGELTKQ